MVLLNDAIVKHYRVQLAGGLVRWRSTFAVHEHNPTYTQPALVLEEVNKRHCLKSSKTSKSALRSHRRHSRYRAVLSLSGLLYLVCMAARSLSHDIGKLLGSNSDRVLRTRGDEVALQ
jgi:hypothetical protein